MRFYLFVGLVFCDRFVKLYDQISKEGSGLIVQTILKDFFQLPSVNTKDIVERLSRQFEHLKETDEKIALSKVLHRLIFNRNELIDLKALKYCSPAAIFAITEYVKYPPAIRFDVLGDANYDMNRLYEYLTLIIVDENETNERKAIALEKLDWYYPPNHIIERLLQDDYLKAIDIHLTQYANSSLSGLIKKMKDRIEFKPNWVTCMFSFKCMKKIQVNEQLWTQVSIKNVLLAYPFKLSDLKPFGKEQIHSTIMEMVSHDNAEARDVFPNCLKVLSSDSEYYLPLTTNHASYDKVLQKLKTLYSDEYGHGGKVLSGIRPNNSEKFESWMETVIAFNHHQNAKEKYNLIGDVDIEKLASLLNEILLRTRKNNSGALDFLFYLLEQDTLRNSVVSNLSDDLVIKLMKTLSYAWASKLFDAVSGNTEKLTFAAAGALDREYLAALKPRILLLCARFRQFVDRIDSPESVRILNFLLLFGDKNLESLIVGALRAASASESLVASFESEDIKVSHAAFNILIYYYGFKVSASLDIFIGRQAILERLVQEKRDTFALYVLDSIPNSGAQPMSVEFVERRLKYGPLNDEFFVSKGYESVLDSMITILSQDKFEFRTKRNALKSLPGFIKVIIEQYDDRYAIISEFEERDFIGSLQSPDNKSLSHSQTFELSMLLFDFYLQLNTAYVMFVPKLWPPLGLSGSTRQSNPELYLNLFSAIEAAMMKTTYQESKPEFETLMEFIKKLATVEGNSLDLDIAKDVFRMLVTFHRNKPAETIGNSLVFFSNIFKDHLLLGPIFEEEMKRLNSQ